MPFFTPKRRFQMNPRADATFDPMAEASPDPFSEPRTIPGGWDVSAFFAPERENLRHYRAIKHGHRSQTIISSPHMFSDETEE
jgi:hypothetical protein